MYQVTFSDQSILELNKLKSQEQLKLIEALGNVNTKDFDQPSEDLGKFNRNGKILYRVRANALRVYFELKELNILFCHYILHQHTLTDFIYRFKLPISENQMIEQHQSFWKYLESLKK